MSATTGCLSGDRLYRSHGAVCGERNAAGGEHSATGSECQVIGRLRLISAVRFLLGGFRKSALSNHRHFDLTGISQLGFERFGDVSAHRCGLFVGRFVAIDNYP
jgi:hypothetical protein